MLMIFICVISLCQNDLITYSQAYVSVQLRHSTIPQKSNECYNHNEWSMIASDDTLFFFQHGIVCDNYLQLKTLLR